MVAAGYLLIPGHATSTQIQETKNPAMSQPLIQLLNQWLDQAGHPPLAPEPAAALAQRHNDKSIRLAAPASSGEIKHWESAHGLTLPASLTAWLTLSNGLVVDGFQWLHPLRCIGPTVRFSPSRRLLLQPHSWYEFGNPFEMPVNIDMLSHCLEAQVFIVGDESHNDPPRIIAQSFSNWFHKAIVSNFNPFWHDPNQFNLGDPVQQHYLRRDPVKLSPRLCKLCSIVGDELLEGRNEHHVMKSHQLNRDELELTIDVYQYRRVKLEMQSQA